VTGVIHRLSTTNEESSSTHCEGKCTENVKVLCFFLDPSRAGVYGSFPDEDD